jgi:hypothetical protein
MAQFESSKEALDNNFLFLAMTIHSQNIALFVLMTPTELYHANEILALRRSYMHPKNYLETDMQ